MPAKKSALKVNALPQGDDENQVIAKRVVKLFNKNRASMPDEVVDTITNYLVDDSAALVSGQAKSSPVTHKYYRQMFKKGSNIKTGSLTWEKWWILAAIYGVDDERLQNTKTEFAKQFGVDQITMTYPKPKNDETPDNPPRPPQEDKPDDGITKDPIKFIQGLCAPFGAKDIMIKAMSEMLQKKEQKDSEGNGESDDESVTGLMATVIKGNPTDGGKKPDNKRKARDDNGSESDDATSGSVSADERKRRRNYKAMKLEKKETSKKINQLNQKLEEVKGDLLKLQTRFETATETLHAYDQKIQHMTTLMVQLIRVIYEKKE